jgi:hypothetical protein
MRPGLAGMIIVIVLQLGLVTSIGVFNPVMATYRLEQTPPDLVARMLSAWSVSTSATIAALTALWGLIAAVTGPRVAIGIAGALLLLTPLLLPRHQRTGPAAGVAAALAADTGVAPAAMDVGAIQDALRAQGAYLSTPATRAG